VFVVGDAGVGKSRLLYEFRSHLAEEGIRYVQGRGHSYGRLTPFLPLIDCLRGIFGIGRAKPERAQELVEQRIRAIDPKLEAFIPILLHMMSIETEDRPLPDYIDDELRSASAKALLRVFTAAGKGLPLVLLLEDWHWADRGSVEVLKQLGEVVSEHSLLVVVTTRPELERSEVSPDADSLWMDLAPLDDDASTEVMRAAMHVSSVSTDLAEHVREKAGGNPFFIEELCHALVERGGVTIEQGEARVEGTLDGLAIPDTVQAVLRTRLDRLDPEAREVLRCASVVGREFGAEVLRRIVPSPSRLDRALDSLCATGLVQRVGLEPEVAYRFKHALTLDVTYNGMLERQRRERHGMVGRAIETLHADHLEEFYDRLSVHFAGGEEWETAVRYGFAAAERAAGLWRYGDAVATLERTRRWIERSGSADADERLVALLLEQERHLEKLGERDQQQRVIDEALSLIPAGPSVERANVLTRQGELATLVGRFEEAQEAFDTAIEVAAACGAADARARALRGLGLKSWRVERFTEGVELLSEVVVYDREHESPPVRVRDLLNLGRFHRELGQWDEAWECLEEAEGLAPKLLGADIGLAVNFKSLLLRAMGRSEEALEAFEEGERVNAGWLEEVAPVRVSLHSLSSAAAHLEAGHIDEALARYEHALDFARRANRFDNLAATLSSYGEALMAIGRPADAARRFEETVEIVERIGDDQMLMLPLEWLARAYEADGDERAADTWARVRGLSAPHCAVQRTLHAYEREARLREDSDRSALLGEALEFAMDLEDGATVARIRNALGIIAWKSDDLETAARHYEAAAGCLEELDDPDRETEYGVVLNGWGAVLAAQGEHERARQVLEKALAVNRQTDDRAREADSWAALGASHRRVGKWPEAHLCYERCAECRRAADDVAGEGWALLRLAEVARERAEPSTDVEAAVARALELAVAAQDPALEEQCRRMGSAEARQ
ncbi:MAG: tetratricopeptide repeat protein, partial [Gemmatimonadota bacterium]